MMTPVETHGEPLRWWVWSVLLEVEIGYGCVWTSIRHFWQEIPVRRPCLVHGGSSGQRRADFRIAAGLVILRPDTDVNDNEQVEYSVLED